MFLPRLIILSLFSIAHLHVEISLFLVDNSKRFDFFEHIETFESITARSVKTPVFYEDESSNLGFRISSDARAALIH